MAWSSIEQTLFLMFKENLYIRPITLTIENPFKSNNVCSRTGHIVKMRGRKILKLDLIKLKS